MSRIIAGSGKGRRLKAPRGRNTRPTGARVKQALFDILAARMPGCRFLDVCAGSGAIGLEATSRGAVRVILVDASASAVAAILANRESLRGSGGDVQVLRQDARIALATLADHGERFDVVYLDPPYESGLYLPLLAQLGETGLLEPEGVAVAEHFHKLDLPERIGRLVQTRRVRVGDHRLSFYRILAGDQER